MGTHGRLIVAVSGGYTPWQMLRVSAREEVPCDGLHCTLSKSTRYSPELKQALEGGSRPTIEWLPYDWKLNSLAHKESR